MRGICGLGSDGRTSPIQGAPLRKELGVKRTRFVSTFGLVFRTQCYDFAGIGRAQEDFSRGVARNAGDLRRTGFGELSENAATVDGEKRAVIPRASKKAAVLADPERIDDIFARSPKL